MSSTSPSTETRGAWLWRKQAAIFGERFYAMWREVDPVEMQATWTEGLRAANVTREGLMLGVSKLYHVKHPPTLPEFIDLCRAQAIYRQNPLALDAPRTSPAEARAQLGRLYEVAAGAVRSQPARDGGIAWADRLFERHERGEAVTLHQLELAREAITAWAATHGEHTNGHTREPGSDDE